MVFKLGQKPLMSEENVMAKLELNSVELSDGSVLEKQALGVFKIRKGDDIKAGLDITANGISFYELKRAMPYKTRDGKSTVSISGEREIVLDPKTLEAKMLKLGSMSYTVQLGRKEITVEDYIQEGDKKYFYSFTFEPGKASEQVKELLKLPLVKEDWEKIKAMKKLE